MKEVYGEYPQGKFADVQGGMVLTTKGEIIMGFDAATGKRVWQANAIVITHYVLTRVFLHFVNTSPHNGLGPSTNASDKVAGGA